MQNIKELKSVLEEKVSVSNQVILTSHNVMNNDLDFDAIGSLIGLELIIKKLGKPVYILIEEYPTKVESGVKKIVDEYKSNINIINIDKYKQIKSDNDLLITTDTNKIDLVCCKDYLNLFKNIILIDHHEENEKTIKTDLKYINPSVSSASEIITELLTLFRVKYNADVANYLLSGIYLDTNKYTKNCPAKTMNNVTRLLDKGADITKVNEFFEEDFLSDVKVHELVSKANFFTYSIAICLADESVRYTKEELAKVADYLLRYKADAAFAAGFIDDELLSISDRSKGKIDVGKIMSEFGGGGNAYSAASKIEDSSLLEVAQQLTKIIKPIFYKEEK